MADLPLYRKEAEPPSTNAGFDVFGSWMVQTRRTRGGVANFKYWGLVFTCLAYLRCDRGSNFVGAKSEIDEALAEMDNESVANYLLEQNCEWIFNPPHASHFGSVWERQIGTTQSILDTMLLELGAQQLTHEFLVTLVSEVMVIVNTCSITVIPSDIEDPLLLTSAMLLTQKDIYAWTTSKYLHNTGCLCSTEIEKVAIPSQSILDQAETRVHQKSPGADEVEERTAKSSSWRHGPDERRASPPKKLAPGLLFGGQSITNLTRSYIESC